MRHSKSQSIDLFVKMLIIHFKVQYLTSNKLLKEAECNPMMKKLPFLMYRSGIEKYLYLINFSKLLNGPLFFHSLNVTILMSYVYYEDSMR